MWTLNREKNLHLKKLDNLIYSYPDLQFGKGLCINCTNVPR